uniref:DUF2203 family protein n=1 Tax=Schlesneria paludicola TaxID=360056 RepID=A0A7C2NZ42_9PLAN
MTAQPVHAKQFTVDAANRTLPLVKAIVADIVTLYRDVSERKDRLESLQRRRSNIPQRQDDPYLEEVEQIRQDLDKEVERLQGYVDELQGLGVELKDPVAGLVDFPATIEGRQAYLCWKLGEPQVEFWHTQDSGYSGRQPLAGLPTDHAV